MIKFPLTGSVYLLEEEISYNKYFNVTTTVRRYQPSWLKNVFTLQIIPPSAPFQYLNCRSWEGNNYTIRHWDTTAYYSLNCYKYFEQIERCLDELDDIKWTHHPRFHKVIIG